MIAAAHLENLLFLLFIFVAFLFQLLAKAASKGGKGSNRPSGPSPRPTPPRISHPSAETDEERVRKFLEALGQPAGSTPPPPVTSRQMDAERAAAEARHRLEQERRAREQPAKTVRPRQPGLPPLTTFPPPLPKVYQPKIEEAPAYEVHDVARPAEPAVPIKIPEQSGTVQADTPGERMEKDFVALLKSPSGLRNAIILREVFGPPKAFSDLMSY